MYGRSRLMSDIISIHASAKEATRILFSSLFASSISIHASAKEATSEHLDSVPESTFQSTPPRRRRQFPILADTLKRDFNPRLREGGDLCLFLAAVLSQLCISIHASAKEATSKSPALISPLFISIHASAKEATTGFPYLMEEI